MSFFKINPKDNVEVSLDGEEGIEPGHKRAIADIAEGQPIVKYGEIIGRASRDIRKGEWVHSHNMRSHLDEDPTYSYDYVNPVISKTQGTFMGYLREDGTAGIRNDIYIIPSVGCVNSVCKKLAAEANKLIRGSIDQIIYFPHQFGCSQLGEDHEHIRKILCSIAKNPNATYVLFVGLGCENNSLSAIKEILKDRKNIEYFNCQEQKDEIQYGLDILKGFIEKASKLKRSEIPLSKLRIGLKCGGSDGFSGITANPTVGRVSDFIVGAGGSAILTEVPEMFGAEQILMNKCDSEKTYEMLVDLIKSFKKTYTDQGFPVYENPSPGNKKGGITTLEEKSCGCITKAGTSKVVDVLKYGETIRKSGLSLLEGPGNDLIASSALAAAGCQIVLFTTGRGTPFSTFVPTLKIGTNDHISTFKDNWIDYNAYSRDDEGLRKLLIATASGEYHAKSEENPEFAFYKKGVTL